MGSLFRIIFVAAGQNSADIGKWLIDSVSITRECRPPRGLVTYGGHGACSFNTPTCFPNFSWSSPDCSDFYTTSFIFDDGSFELQAGLEGQPGYFGNFFPVDATTNGYFTSFDLYFTTIIGTSLTLNIFDSTRNLIYTSLPFYPYYPGLWTNVSVDSVPFNGPFYGMIFSSGQVYEGLEMDTDGPYASTDLAWSILGGSWAKISTFSMPASVLGIRANAQIPYKKALVPGGMEFQGKPDTSNLLGYNLYRKKEFYYPDSVFFRLNNQPLIQRQFSDSIPCMASYYVTAVYSNDCESGPSNTLLSNPCWVGVDEVESSQLVRVSPNPANSLLEW